jgi:hypothetical protein
MKIELTKDAYQQLKRVFPDETKIRLNATHTGS